mmetsp:Transcript_36294/g.67401  ORF Transcript_36294/g.67401 Transcript_36294/m.67401 type:complete len:476 (+) Transcript_36294:133-1560(+)|eukprot:CAMPEP_0196129896 /NCGR_PEP_ID=MMETSP0910-20130528/454_1 /TAXON_ID=49265 /ORGANISM="Thalassiosira rotula, Strain GSO102" /LENGTH=475 /DNA_ID=CAMNT_0041389095 /DNA_START=45 /DNA_END=1472 /DNA_ORIENTATION=-
MPISRFLLVPPLIQVALTKPWPSHAFVSPVPSRTTNSKSITVPPQPLLTLHASKSAAAKKKKKNKSSSKKVGGGFGSPTTRKQAKSKDAVVYPDLEPQVVQTLVPSPQDGADEESGGVLFEEMYDRLEEIYGLEKFNFGGEGAIYKSIGIGSDDGGGKEEDESGGSSLFDDILSGGGASQSSSPLDDLLSPPSLPSASISLNEIVKSSTTQPTKSSFDLNSIPPFQKFRVLHTDPMVLAIDDFLTTEECDEYIQISLDSEKKEQQPGGGEDDPTTAKQPMLLGQSQTVGKDSRSKAQRTSTTWFHHYEGVPALMAKASRLLGLEGIERWEEPQTVRYRRSERFTWHLDALSPEEATSATGAGQRVATLLAYLTDLPAGEGGATMFRDLGGDGPLKVRPKKGSALLFFPAAGGIPNAPFDIRTLHCGEAVAEDAANEKWIAQLWLRQSEYKPTAPAGNEHGNASGAIGKYCDLAKV